MHYNTWKHGKKRAKTLGKCDINTTKTLHFNTGYTDISGVPIMEALQRYWYVNTSLISVLINSKGNTLQSCIDYDLEFTQDDLVNTGNIHRFFSTIMTVYYTM